MSAPSSPDVMDGRQGVQPHGLAQLAGRQGPGFFPSKTYRDLLLMRGHNARLLGTGKTVAWRIVPGASALLQELLTKLRETWRCL